MSLGTLGLSAQGADRCADLFHYVEPGSLEWVRARNHEVNDIIRKSPNSVAIKGWLKKAYFSEPIVRKSIAVNTRRSWDLIDYGLDQPVKLVQTENGEAKTIYSGEYLKKNKSIDFLNFVPSKDFKKVIMVFSEKGSIDRYRLMVLDVEKNRILLDNRLLFRDPNDIKWTSPNTFTFNVQLADGMLLKEYDLRTSNLTGAEEAYTSETPKSWGAYWTGSNWILRKGRAGREIHLPDVTVADVLGELGSNIILRIQKSSGKEVLVKVVSRSTQNPAKAIEIPLAGGRILDESFINENRIIAMTRKGTSRWIEVVNSTGGNQKRARVPSCCRVGTVGVVAGGHKLSVELISPLHSSQEFIYDFDKQAWEDDSLESKMLTADGRSYVSELVEVTSEDGTTFPMRLTRRQDLKPNGQNPVLLSVYGSDQMDSDPEYNLTKAEFLKRGGIIASPAVRGGGEFGPSWNKAGQGAQNKINTVKDFIASARWFAQQGWSAPNKIISEGESHGGFLVASAALMAPESFGLVISWSGVQDLLNKDRLDPLADGFKDFWGDSNDPTDREYLEKISPVELAKKDGPHPKFFIVTGDDDSRVNKEHSDRLAEVLRAHSQSPEDVLLLHVKNIGHQLMDMSSHGNQALRVNVVKWTLIYDYLGWKF
jgi:prolyl oligopeptidase PreP (S9A serine peptidase family)